MDSRIREVSRILPELMFSASDAARKSQAADDSDGRKKRKRDRLLLEAAAEKVNLSTSYLRQLFKANMKITFKQYADKLRMERARALAEDTHLTVSQIMAEIRVDDDRSFRRKLKQTHGLTLSQYRKRCNEQFEA
jgi:two-component system response regulator YesN